MAAVTVPNKVLAAVLTCTMSLESNFFCGTPLAYVPEFKYLTYRVFKSGDEASNPGSTLVISASSAVLGEYALLPIKSDRLPIAVPLL